MRTKQQRYNDWQRKRSRERRTPKDMCRIAARRLADRLGVTRKQFMKMYSLIEYDK